MSPLYLFGLLLLWQTCSLNLIRIIVGTRLQAERQHIRSAGQLPAKGLRNRVACCDLGIQGPARLGQDRTPLRRRRGVCLAVQVRRLAISDQGEQASDALLVMGAFRLK